MSWFSIICMAVGSGLLVIGLLASLGRYHLSKRGTRTRGVVSALEYNEKGERKDAVRPVVTFVVASEQGDVEHTLRPDGFTDPPKYKIGDELPVLYDARDPSQAYIATASELWVGPVVMLVLGVVLVLAAVGAHVGVVPVE